MISAFKIGNISAQQNELDPVTVTSTLLPLSSSVTGRNITVIKSEQFSKLPVNSIDELLRYIPGVEVQMRGPMGAQSDIVLRGGTFHQILVILDGIRLNNPNTGHFNSYIPNCTFTNRQNRSIKRCRICYLWFGGCRWRYSNHFQNISCQERQ